MMDVADTREFEREEQGLLAPASLHTRSEVLARPSVVPAAPGVYAWYFDEIPRGVPTDGCHNFGGHTLQLVTRYWTADQTNHLLPALDGVLLFNRLLWLGVSALLLAGSFVLFRTDREGLRLPRRKPRAEPPLLRPQAGTTALELPKAALAFDTRARLAQLRAQFAFDLRGVLQGAAFIVLTVLALVLMLASLAMSGLVYGTPTWPVTHQVLTAVDGSFSLPLMIVLIFYAGELVWRERQYRSAENWVV